MCFFMLVCSLNMLISTIVYSLNVLIFNLPFTQQEFDTNKDGCISHKEFRNALISQKFYSE